MSLGKLPVIKGLVSTSQSRRRFKSDLSVDMISPPLGDFRHTMHIGRGGDVFGDTSFLSSYGGPAHDEEPDSPSGSRPARFLSRTLRHVRKNPAARLRGGSRDLSSPPPSVSPIIKNAISLPQLNLDASNGGLKRTLLSTSISSPADSLFSYSLLDSGFVTLPHFSRMDQNFREASGSLCSDYRRSSLPENSDMTLTRSDSLTSFTVDLGPSLMTEVLGLIDSSRGLFSSSKDWDMEESSSVSPQDDDDDEQLNMCPVREEVRIEPQRFQEAADVLARHFGGEGGLIEEEGHRSSSFRHERALYTFTETEEEINL
ncbi:Cdc42 effector protein 1 [Triplophysa tibetana]|uniref:Cdc42 effector protein 1 n=1 Tax=Triplophysa tibetana TaxID=1572043 RepID=A0A5A9N8M9_9TELE|nr:Cdc42 effector protein 1 [Triplophysa tibetana]